jgi:hypothetical protein
MKIAILAWGSLLWNPDTIRIATPFTLTGPNLPIEFCRISKNGRLTLIIDEDFGTLCQTYAAPSAFSTLDEAIENLREREAMPHAQDVGFIDLTTATRSPLATQRHQAATETIAAWTQPAGYDAAIWTALPSDFTTAAGEPFSVNAAIRYLESLEQSDSESFTRALAYIRNAPPATQTPLRDRVTTQWPAPPPPS